MDIILRMNSMRSAMDGGDYHSAYNEAVPLNLVFLQYGTLQDYSHYRNFMFNYGVLLSHLGQEDQSIQALKRSAERFKFEKGEKDKVYQLCLLWIAEDYIKLGDYLAAKAYLDEVEQLHSKDKDVRQKMVITKAELLYTEGKSGEALALLETIKKPDENLQALIDSYRVVAGGRTQVVERLQKRYAGLQKITDADLGWLNRLAVNLGAEKGTLHQAIEIGNKLIDYYNLHNLVRNPMYPTLLQNQAIYNLRLGNLEEAKSLMQRAKKVMDAYGGQVLPRMSLLENFAELEYKMGEYNDAAELALENMELNREQLAFNLLRNVDQRNNYWDNYGRWYVSNFPKIALSSGDSVSAAESYNSLLAGKGMINYSDKVFGEIASREGGKMKELWDKYVELDNNIKEERNFDKFSRMVEQRDKVFDQFASLCRDHEDFKNAFSFSWEKVAEALKPAESAVEFFEYTDSEGTAHYGAAVIPGSGRSPQLAYIGKADELARLNAGDVGADMWNSVWKPIQQYLSGSKKVYFAPAGTLYTLPIEYSGGKSDPLYVRLTSTRNLQDRSNNGKDEGWDDMVLYGGLTYRMTPATMQAEHNKYPRRRGVDHSFSRQGAAENISPLENTLIEVEEIAELVRPKLGNTPILLTGRSGVEESFKALSGNSPEVLHVATHGFFFDPSAQEAVPETLLSITSGGNSRYRVMRNSGLLLAGSNKAFVENESPVDTEDGILTAQEISELDLSNTDIAVLSACETGLGQISGDGVAGLQSAFKQAGVDTLLISLWKVDDEATSLLMKEFYRNWMIENKSQHEALAKAQDYIRNNKENPQWNSPDYWAAFILLDSLE